MGRFETRWLTSARNLSAVTDLSGRWVDHVHGHRTDLPSRAEAIRRLIHQALKAKGKAPTAAPPPGKPR